MAVSIQQACDCN